jgi:hypothetical protein
VDPIEAKHAEFAGEPEIAIGGLSHREDGSYGKLVPYGPCRVRVLAHFQRWIQRENGIWSEQRADCAYREKQRLNAPCCYLHWQETDSTQVEEDFSGGLRPANGIPKNAT